MREGRGNKRENYYTISLTYNLKICDCIRMLDWATTQAKFDLTLPLPHHLPAKGEGGRVGVTVIPEYNICMCLPVSTLGR